MARASKILNDDGMDVSVVASSIVTFLVPYLTKAGEEFAGEAGKVIYAKVGALFARVKECFSANPAAKQVSQLFEEEPDDYASALKNQLERMLSKDANLLAEFGLALEQIERAGSQLAIVQRVVKAHTITGLISDGSAPLSANIQQVVDEAVYVTGAIVGKKNS